MKRNRKKNRGKGKIKTKLTLSLLVQFFIYQLFTITFPLENVIFKRKFYNLFTLDSGIYIPILLFVYSFDLIHFMLTTLNNYVFV